MTTEPIHLHDCAWCVFVGADKPSDGEPRVNQVDMYVHRYEDGLTLIRRYGDEGGRYGSWWTSGGPDFVTARYLPVYLAAKQRGLI